MLGFRRHLTRKLARGAPSSPGLDWDIHCHLLPGVDDGVRTMDDALEAIRALHALGYRGSVITPHIYHGVYPNKRDNLTAGLSALRAEVAATGLDYQMSLAAEYFADEHMIALVAQEPLLSFGPPAAPHVLLEYPYSTEPPLWADSLTALVDKGYTPVLAHIERYHFVTKDPDLWLGRFARFGVKIQCNIGSLVGQYGRQAMDFAQRMRASGLPTFWGTDLHRASQVEKFVRPGLTHLVELGTLNRELQP